VILDPKEQNHLNHILKKIIRGGTSDGRSKKNKSSQRTQTG
jgi:hypothetical protein